MGGLIADCRTIYEAGERVLKRRLKVIKLRDAG
jgi:hypothetical protein